MSSPVEQIKERVAVADLIGQHVKLERAGANFKARCPFHSEKTPSFFVSPARNSYYCFGCGAKGDIFTFIEQFEGVDFRGALHTLAARAGVELTPERPEKRDARERLYALLRDAEQFFVNQLADTKDAREYLAKRGVSEGSVDAFRLGYAPAAWRALHEHLTGLGYSERECEQAGVVRRSSGEGAHTDRRYDTFRGRIMFPIRDTVGRTVAFSGRHFADMPGGKRAEEPPKYINSPETELFNKSKLLFGFDRARGAIRKAGFAIVVEGQMDVVMSHQAGFTNAVAPLGTALTGAHLEALQRFSSNVVFAFDADSAGVQSSGRSTRRAMARGLDVKLAVLPPSQDPADTIAAGGRDAWRAVVREARHVIDFYLEHLRREAKDERAFARAVSTEVVPYIALIQNKIDQAHFVSKAAGALGVPESAIHEEVDKADTAAFLGADEITDAPPDKQTGSASEEVPLRKDVVARKLIGIVLWQEQEQQKSPPAHAENTQAAAVDTKHVRADIEKQLGKERAQKLFAEGEQMRDELIFEAEVSYGAEAEGVSTRLEQDVDEFVRTLCEEEVRTKFSETMSQLKRAEAAGDQKQAGELLTRCRELSKELYALQNKA